MPTIRRSDPMTTRKVRTASSDTSGATEMQPEAPEHCSPRQRRAVPGPLWNKSSAGLGSKGVTHQACILPVYPSPGEPRNRKHNSSSCFRPRRSIPSTSTRSWASTTTLDRAYAESGEGRLRNRCSGSEFCSTATRIAVPFVDSATSGYWMRRTCSQTPRGVNRSSPTGSQCARSTMRLMTQTSSVSPLTIALEYGPTSWMSWMVRPCVYTLPSHRRSIHRVPPQTVENVPIHEDLLEIRWTRISAAS